MNDELRKTLDACGSLPTLPGVDMQILELCRSKEVSLGKIAIVVSRDPALSAKVLQVVNSPFHGMRRNITTLNHACGFWASGPFAPSPSDAGLQPCRLLPCASACFLVPLPWLQTQGSKQAARGKARAAARETLNRYSRPFFLESPHSKWGSAGKALGPRPNPKLHSPVLLG